ncbi:MAG: hypothetical protein J5755_00560, partial [Clostridia bacterium]|nr:hypothetical protein [Clostridia bacterium]
MVEIRLQEDKLTVVSGGFALDFAVGDKPLAVGNGRNRYKMSHGSFFIKEKISRRKSLTIVGVSADGDDYLVKFDLGALRLRLEGEAVKFLPEGFEGFDRMWLTLPSEPHECYYGSGEVFSEYDLKGLKATVWVA